LVNSLIGPLVYFFGIDLNRIKSLANLPKFIMARSQFIRVGGQIGAYFPVLTDFESNAGIASGQYFHQDLLVASFIYNESPIKHVDVGSRIDGFVAHVASFRAIEVLDVRPMPKSQHKNIEFRQFDFMNENIALIEKSDSISCLHALEHFGLGRYGDPIDPIGHIKGFTNLANMLESGGKLYVSVPIGRSNKVFFNAHRVFHPLEVLNWMKSSALELLRFDFVDDDGVLVSNHDLMNSPPDVFFGCGIYTLGKH
jgi:hypothetical protein